MLAANCLFQLELTLNYYGGMARIPNEQIQSWRAKQCCELNTDAHFVRQITLQEQNRCMARTLAEQPSTLYTPEHYSTRMASTRANSLLTSAPAVANSQNP